LRRYVSPNIHSLWVLIGINIVVFIFTVIVPGILYTLGLQPATFLQRPWTILTNLFVHAGITHVLFNMLTLFFFGMYLSRMIGEKWFLLVYFLGGIVGNVFYILLGAPYSIAVGASGAIFALGGVLTVLVPKSKVFVFPIPVPIPLWVAVIVGFLLISFMPGVAWQAHLGGLLTGLAAGYYFRRQKRFYLPWR